MNFVNPIYLLGLIVLVPVVGLWLLGYRSRVLTRHGYMEKRLDHSPRWTMRSQWFNLAAWTLASALLVMAAAGPKITGAPQSVPAGTLQVVVVLDVSKSMAPEDYRYTMPDNGNKTEIVGPFGSRLDMAKFLIKDLMKNIRGNELGIVTYTGEGFAQADLSHDFVALKFIAEKAIRIAAAPGGGSDYARGLTEALATFKRDEDPNKQKVIVLMSDGGFTGDQAELQAVVEELRKNKVRLIVLGLGTPQNQPIPIYVNNQLVGYEQLKEDQSTAILEAPLRQLAGDAQGEYAYVGPGDATANLSWPSRLAGSKAESHETPIYQYPLVAGLILLIGLSLTGFKRRETAL
jgi:Ca-activated chloride channel family protein